MTTPRKVAIVTGGGRGIGEAIARRFAADGLAVLITSTDGKTAQAVADDLAARGAAVAAIGSDVADPAQAPRLVETALARFGRLDVLVNNAGTSSFQKFLELQYDEWQRVMAVNLTGMAMSSVAAGRHMAEQRSGRIVNLASVVGERAIGGRTSYGTSKAAIIQLTRQMAIELAPFGVTVNAIAPGAIETDMVRKVHTPEMRAALTRSIPLGRYGHVDEIAHAAAYLASDGAAYVTGTTLEVDGGIVNALAFQGTGGS
jgi:NAD(P)-dependent dehydrogenase (short-subunit alcohol dehydrogenase family)